MQYLTLRLKNPFSKKRYYTQYWWEKKVKLNVHKHLLLSLTKPNLADFIDIDLYVQRPTVKDTYFEIVLGFKIMGLGFTIHVFDNRSRDDLEYQ